MAQNIKKTVFLTCESPYPSSSGGKIRDAQIIKLLLEQMEVETLYFAEFETQKPSCRETNRRGLKMSSIMRDDAPIWKRTIHPLRPHVLNGYSKKMADALRARAEPGTLLWISRLAMAQYLPMAKKLGYRIILDEHRVETKALISNALSSTWSLPSLFLAAQCRYFESRFCQAADAVVATSDIDAARLQKLAPHAALHVIPNCIDSFDYEQVRGQRGTTIFFAGTLSYAPNIEGLEWFLSKVLPKLRASLGIRLPRIVVAGANPSREFKQRLEDAGIEVHANPASMTPFLAEAAIVMIPIRSGSGTRLKVLEGMAAGRAVVSTNKGAEGLILSPGYDVWIAEGADHFTSAILRLLSDPVLRAELGAHATETIATRYDWRCSRPTLRELLERLSD